MVPEPRQAGSGTLQTSPKTLTVHAPAETGTGTMAHPQGGGGRLGAERGPKPGS